VELGSYRGRSTVALALGARDAGRGVVVYAVEPHQNYTGIFGGKYGPVDRAAFYRNMLRTGCYQNVALMNLPSAWAASGFGCKVGLLFIDGDHSEEGVRRDWACWSPLLAPGATVAFDDATAKEAGPYKLLADLLQLGQWRETAAVDDLRVIERT
jgi:hypothetical protein